MIPKLSGCVLTNLGSFKKSLLWPKDTSFIYEGIKAK